MITSRKRTPRRILKSKLTFAVDLVLLSYELFVLLLKSVKFTHHAIKGPLLDRQLTGRRRSLQ